jgi:hypothetical protein
MDQAPIESSPHWQESRRRIKAQVNQRAYRLAQEQYETYRKMMWEEIHAGQLDLDGIDEWKP